MSIHTDLPDLHLGKCERVEVKRRFSLAKRKYGLGLITTKLKKSGVCSVDIKSSPKLLNQNML